MMTILALPLGLALGVTVWSPSAPLLDAPIAAAQLWQKPESDSRDTKEPRSSKEPRDPKDPKELKKAAPKKHRGPDGAGGGKTGAGAKSTDVLEAEVFGESPTTVRRKPTHRRHHALKRDDGDDDAASGDDDSDEADDDEEDDDGERTASLAVIAPRLVSLGVGTAFIGRSFHFNAPLQPESTFPRAGIAIELESFPLSQVRGWIAGLGVGASFGTELGSAGVQQADGGRLSYPVTEQRWEASLRYALPLGEHVLAVPAIGFGHSSYDVERKTELAPSACGSTSAQVCLPDVRLSHLALGLGIRFAVNSSVAIALGGAYLLGFGIDKGAGQLGSEADTTARGVSGELALVWQLKDWLAVRIAAPLVRYSYSFKGQGLPYSAATETYYGGIIGATIFTR